MEVTSVQLHHESPIIPVDHSCHEVITAILEELISRITPELGSDSLRKPTDSEVAPVSTAIISSDERVVAISTVEEPLIEEKPKEMVVLRNLEITPPPTTDNVDSPKIATNNQNVDDYDKNNKSQQIKRKMSPLPQSDANDSIESTGRSKRQRTQTKLFQVGETEAKEKTPTSILNNSHTRPRSRGRQKSTASTTSEENLSNAEESLIQSQDVIYERNDYLALRNESDSFYLCQLTEHVRANCEFIRVRWLDSEDENKTYYYTTQYDKVPRKSIIMPVTLTKLKGGKSKAFFSLGDQDRANIMDRLKRSLNICE